MLPRGIKDNVQDNELFTIESSPTSSEGYRKPTWSTKKRFYINEEEINEIQQKKGIDKSWPLEFSPEVQNYNFYYFCWLAPAGCLALDPRVPLPHGLLKLIQLNETNTVKWRWNPKARAAVEKVCIDRGKNTLKITVVHIFSKLFNRCLLHNVNG